jgi:hypothetical protein
VGLLRSFSKVIQEHAAVTLRNLSVNPENKAQMVRDGCLPPVIACLSSPEHKVQEQAAIIIRNLALGTPFTCLASTKVRALTQKAAVDDDNEEVIVECGAVPPLIALLRSPYERLQEHAAVALRNLTVNDRNETRVAEDGALPPLILLLRSPDKRIQEQALGVLRNLSVSSANKVRLVNEGALPGISPLLSSLVQNFLLYWYKSTNGDGGGEVQR